jgi:WD40 repeat protein
MEVKAFVCEYNNCNLIYENPVTLVCGNTLCNEHLEHLNDKFQCNFCQQEHPIPLNGFALNRTIHKIIESYLYFDPLRRNIKETFDNLHRAIEQYENIDPNIYIYDYFSKIRNKIDLHREELIEEINTKSDELIKKLKEKELKCNLNLTNLEKINLNELKMNILPLWKHELRQPEFSQEKLNELLVKMKDHVQNMQYETKKYKRKLILNELIQFDKLEKSSLFGQLTINNCDFILADDCGELDRNYIQHTNLIRSIQVNENCNKLISASNDKTIKIWNLETGECLKSLKKHQSSVSSVLIISNNKFISGSEDKTIRIWDQESHECLNTLTNESGVSCLCLISDIEIACGCNDGSINIWNLDRLTKIKTIRAHDGWIPYLKLTDNFKLISCSSDKKIKVWNLTTFVCQKELIGHLNTIYFLESNVNLMSCSSDKTIKLWNLETCEILRSILFDHPVYCMEILNDDLISVGIGNDKYGEIQIFNLNKIQMVKSIPAHLSFVYRLSLLSNGGLLSGSGNGEMKLWKLIENKS